jgi:1-deoxy-D-xylulose-5-phosphate reductoisomerase
MTERVTNIAVLGSTGSIGRSTLEVIAASQGALCAVAISANTRLSEALQQAREFRPRWLIATDPAAAERFDWSELPLETELLVGHEQLESLVARDEIDTVVTAIVGAAGLRGTWAAVDAGKTVALANKETLVAAGPLVTRLAQDRGATILPIDSEHSAVFQSLKSGRREEVRRIILTASGGPFLRHTQQQLLNVTVEDALAHPTWSMGKKITVDSATMMNKALEIIEAKWLFSLDADQIDVVIHPQSIVHSMVEYVDGSVVAQLSPPDMRLPIQYALTYPDRRACPAPQLDWSQGLRLEFEPPDVERFPAILLGREVARSGGTAGAVVNAANEAAVAMFLRGELAFTEIVPACRAVVEHHNFDPSPSLELLLELDAWARQEVAKWVCA